MMRNHRHVFLAVLTGALLVGGTKAAEIQGDSEADLAVSVDDGVATVEPDGSVTWTMVVANLGPWDTLAQVADTFPAEATTVTWDCTASGSAFCPPHGAGNVLDLVFIPAGETVTYVATAVIDASVQTQFTNTMLAGTLNGVVDPDGSNNVAADTDEVAYTTPPIVTRLASAASPNSCGLPDHIETGVGITQLTMRFSQVMLDPPNNTESIDVTNPANYRVIEAGVDGVVDSTTCSSAPAGDDNSVDLFGLSYDTETNLVALQVDADLKALPAGTYRVLACAAGLANASGIPLDGGQNGTADDFRSDFRVLGSNLLVNPNFDHPFTNGWTAEQGHVADQTLDADDVPFSGSVANAELGQSNVHGIEQCISAIEPGYYRIGFRSLDEAITGGAVVTVGQTCDGVSVNFFGTRFFNPVAGSWDRSESDVVHLAGSPPPEGWSIRVNGILNNSAYDRPARADSWFVRREDDDIIFRTSTDFPDSCESN